MNNQYSQLTIDVTSQLSKQEKKDYGIFITPLSIINKLFQDVIDFITKKNIVIQNILEPSCGTCEIINYCDTQFNNVNIHGIEFNTFIFEKINTLNFKNNVTIEHTDFLKFNNTVLYDLIIGNPPYFVCKKENISKKYKEYICGRPNIFGLFILHSISMLKSGGIIAFVIPKSFLNSAYYAKIREYITKTCKIIKIEDYQILNDFIDTDQATIGIILQKQDTITYECSYSIKIGKNIIFTDNLTKLKELLEGSTTIQNMGLKVKTGQIVWNENKELLTNDNTCTVLIYNTNITKNNTIEIKNFKNKEKKQFIQKEGKNDVVLVVNRGNGNSAYKLNYALIEIGPYLVENHLNEIYSPQKINKKELIEKYNLIIKSFQNEKTDEFIHLFLGNNGFSKTELESILPIYL